MYRIGRRSFLCAGAVLAVAACGGPTSSLDLTTYRDEIVTEPVLDYGQTMMAADLGSIGRYVEGVFCAGPFEDIPASALTPFIDNYQIGANWRSAMTRYGFQTTRPGRRASNYYVEASIVDANIEACRPPPGRERTIRTYAGGAEMTVNWSVRTSAADEEAYALQVVAQVDESRSQQADLTSLIEAAMVDATDRLATDPGFRSRFFTHSDDPLIGNLVGSN